MIDGLLSAWVVLRSQAPASSGSLVTRAIPAAVEGDFRSSSNSAPCWWVALMTPDITPLYLSHLQHHGKGKGVLLFKLQISPPRELLSQDCLPSQCAIPMPVTCHPFTAIAPASDPWSNTVSSLSSLEPRGSVPHTVDACHSHHAASSHMSGPQQRVL